MQNKPDPFIERQLDLNLNIGESCGHGHESLEKELMPLVTSVNVASGAHSGDAPSINKAIQSCQDYPLIALGGLISYPDLQGFGFRKIQLSNEELRASVISQIGSLAALAKSNKFELQHIRVHGYLYDQLLTNYSIAETVAKAIQEFSNWLILVGPSSQVLKEVGSWTNLRVAFEARYDRRYKQDGLQIPFDENIDSNLNIEEIAERARRLVYKSVVKTENQEDLGIKFETIHISKAGKSPVEVAKLLKAMLVNPCPLKSIDYEPYLSEFI
jgi:5-oxoprolinase (ATP-hydrolysing) subunit A